VLWERINSGRVDERSEGKNEREREREGEQEKVSAGIGKRRNGEKYFCR
jgi:hypothetical protein